MGKNSSGGAKKPPGADEDVLRGTTLRIYRLMYREGRPMGLHEIQRALDLSSASIPQYHINKLIAAGLVKEQDGGGYYVDSTRFRKHDPNKKIPDSLSDNIHHFFHLYTGDSTHDLSTGNHKFALSLRHSDQLGISSHICNAGL